MNNGINIEPINSTMWGVWLKWDKHIMMIGSGTEKEMRELAEAFREAVK